MILSIFILLNLMVFIFFFIFGKKELHILEVTAYFFFAGIPVQNLSALLCLDLEWITISSSQSLEWAEVINRSVLIPILVVWFLSLFIHTFSSYKKLGYLLFFTCLLTGIEYLSESLGLLNHAHWKFWWSFALNACLLFIAIPFMFFFRSHFYKGIKKYV
jgi:hypothetical protein